MSYKVVVANWMVSIRRLFSVSLVTLAVGWAGAVAVIANAQTSESLAVWTDPDTKLTWALKDNGSSISQKEADAYCRGLRLAGFQDWRLPTVSELTQIYDKSANQRGKHIKGGITLANDPWSSSERQDQEGFWIFDFRSGNRMSYALGSYTTSGALCVHGINPAAASTAEAPVSTTTPVDLSKYVSANGITIPRGVSGAPKGGGVYFEPIRGQEMIISLTGNPAFAGLQYTGTMEPTSDGKLGGGTDKFKPTQIQTSKKLNKWGKISSFSIGQDGFLIVKDESGVSYKIKLGLNGGTIEEVGKSSP